MAGGTALELARLGLQVREPHFSTSFWRPFPSTDLVTRSLSIDDACRQALTAQWPSDPISSGPLSEPARKLKRQQTVKLRKPPMPVSDSTEGVGPATKGHSAPSQSAPFRLRTPYPEAPPPGVFSPFSRWNWELQHAPGQSGPNAWAGPRAAVGVVVTEVGSRFREKHLSGVRGTDRTRRPVPPPPSLVRVDQHRLAGERWRKRAARPSASILMGRPLAKREFVKAIRVETTVPLLDATSNSTADFTVRLAPERTTDVNPPTTLPPAGTPTPGAAAFTLLNFRLSIVGLDCNRISKIEWVRTIPDLTAR